MKHLYGKSKISLIFSEGRDTYSIFIILHHMLTETSKEQGTRDSVSFYRLMVSVLSSKDGKLFAKLSGSLSASALLKGNNVLGNTDVTRINFHCLKGIHLPDLSAARGFARCH